MNKFKVDLLGMPYEQVSSIAEKAKPFVKWAGGKRSILQEIKKYIPQEYNDYYEPFVGGGALFFDLSSKKAFISDTNVELILTYLTIKKELPALFDKLKEHAMHHSKEYFYKIRQDQSLQNHLDLAARFIYLNKTCYNGLYRVNKKREFNTPIGSYKNPNIYDRENLLRCREHLINMNTVIKIQNFDKIKPQKKDFVYFDPPYHQTYSGYSSIIFGEEKQIELRDFCNDLSKKGVYFTLSNSDTDFIRELYKDYNINYVMAPRYVNCKSSGRAEGKEVIITNHGTGWKNS